MKKIISALVSFLVATTSLAGEIWVTSSDLTTREALEKSVAKHRAQIHENDFISSFDAQINRPVQGPLLASILKLEDGAQSASLNGHFAAALDLYKKLQQKLETIPNVSGVERITFSVFIHMAELHDLLKDKEGERAWKQARAWYSKDLTNSGEFSPQAVRKFNETRNSFSAMLEISAPLESAVYVDGRLLSISENRFRKNLNIGYHQVSVLTPGSEWMVKTIQILTNESRDLSFRPEPIVEGTCEAPRYIGSELPAKTKLLVIFGDCERVMYEKTWFSINGRRMESLSPGPSAPTITTEMSLVREGPGFWSDLSHSKWFWSGVAVFAIGATTLMLQNQNQTPTFTPTNSIK